MKRIFSLANLRLIVEILLVVAALTIILSRSTPTEAAAVPAPAAAPNAGWYTCNSPDQVAVFFNRVHVRCTSTTPTISGVSWFAVPTSPDSAVASRFLGIFQSALVAGRPLILYVDPADTTGSSFGCGAGDCRRLIGAEIQ
jgi:hypothetical protein